MAQNKAAADRPLMEVINEFIHADNDFAKALAYLESKTGVKRIKLFAGCVVVLSLYLIVGYAPRFIVALVGLLYPTYASVKAIESPQKEDDTQWLTYWVVYSSFNIAEFFSDIFLSWFPLYFLFKCAFLGWCMAPFSWNGSEYIYRKVILPTLAQHQARADKLLTEASNAAAGLLSQVEGEAQKVAKVAIDHVVAEAKDQQKKD